jgi:hypothetical protein
VGKDNIISRPNRQKDVWNLSTDFEPQKFDGDQINWTTFWDEFKTTIHQNPDVKINALKLRCLKSHLGEATYKLMKNFPATDSNYLIALDLLKRSCNHSKSATTTGIPRPPVPHATFSKLSQYSSYIQNVLIIRRRDTNLVSFKGNRENTRSCNHPKPLSDPLLLCPVPLRNTYDHRYFSSTGTPPRPLFKDFSILVVHTKLSYHSS